MTQHETLLRPGDEMVEIIERFEEPDTYTLIPIAYIGAGIIMLTNGHKYGLYNLCPIYEGPRTFRRRLVPANDYLRKLIRHREIAYYLYGFDWHRMSSEFLEGMVTYLASQGFDAMVPIEKEEK